MNNTKYKHVILRGTTCPAKFKIGKKYKVKDVHYDGYGADIVVDGDKYYILVCPKTKTGCTHLYGTDAYWEFVEPKEKIVFERNEEGFYNYAELVDYKTANAFLKQEFGKDWHMKIDVEKLDMDDSECCVLGQLCGNFFTACVKHFGFAEDYIMAYGYVESFHAEWETNYPFGFKTPINWKKKIAKRQSKTAKKGEQ